MDGYGNDVTASFYDPSLDPSSSVSSVGYGDVNAPSSDAGTIAQALAQMFSTGVTAYTDSQAIQRGYTISNPRYFQSGYPGGVSNPYAAAPQGAGVVAAPPSSGNGLLLLLIVGVVVFALAKA